MREHKIYFIKNIIIFLVILSILVAGFNIAYIKLIQPQKLVERRLVSYENLVNSLDNKSLDYVFFGDSHIEGGINPRYIEGNVFNFAIGGQSYTETYYLLKKLLEKDDVKFKSIVLQLDPHTFSESVRGGKFLFDQIYFYSKFVDYRKMAELKGESLISVFLRVKFPFLGNGKQFIDSILKFDDYSSMYLGWSNRHSVGFTGDREKISQKAFESYFTEGSNMIDQQTFEYFLKTLELAKENNINVIFFKFPISEEYYAKIAENRDIESYYDYIFTEADKTLDDYQVMDLHDYFFDKGKYYYDPEHLIISGSEILSKSVNEELLKITH